MNTDSDAPMDNEEMKRYAREFARKGGLKGGPARAAKLSPERRSAIARKAVKKRWKNYRAKKNNK